MTSQGREPGDAQRIGDSSPRLRFWTDVLTLLGEGKAYVPVTGRVPSWVAMIDWRLADTVAHAVAGTQPVPPAGAFERPAAVAREAEELVSAYTRLSARGPVPTAEAIDRSGWIVTNLSSLESALGPVAEKAASGMSGAASVPGRLLAGAVLAVEVGAVSGFLATRVLGQYEFPVLDPARPARLLFVAPNLAGAARTMEAEEDALLRWVALHEVTHALQFEGVPWLRGHLASRVKELLASVEVKPKLKLPDPSAVLGSLLRGDVMSLVLGPERKRLMDDLQATMALVEGHAEHVMDAVGADVVPDLPALRAAMERKRETRSSVMAILEKLIGFDLKRRQYKQGKAFVDAVVARGGIEALNRAWERPENLPRPDELERPDRWLARTA